MKKDADNGKGTAAGNRDAVHRYVGAGGTFTAEDRQAVDSTRIYDFVADLYCEANGRPSVDPVEFFKMVMIQHEEKK